jgi:hypothetical protein
VLCAAGWFGSIASTPRPETAATRASSAAEGPQGRAAASRRTARSTKLSACLGIARTALLRPARPPAPDALAAVLARIQNELFNLGSDLATLPADRHPQQP